MSMSFNDRPDLFAFRSLRAYSTYDSDYNNGLQPLMLLIHSGDPDRRIAMTKSTATPKKQAKAKVPAKSPKLKQETQTTTRKPDISYATAQEKYGLVDRDLQYLGLPACARPYYRKYDISELEYISAKKKAWAESRKIEKEAERAAKEAKSIKEREAERQAGEASISHWQEKSKLDNLKPQSDSKLPADIWRKILEMLSSDIELEGVRGPSVIARDLCNVSRVNKELYIASLPAFQHLGSLCETIQQSLYYPSYSQYYNTVSSGDTDALWDILVSNPTSLICGQLKIMLAGFGMETAWTKVVMTHKLLQQLGIQKPTRYPAQLLLSVRKEKHDMDWPLAQYYDKATEAQRIRCDDVPTFEIRKRCLNEGFSTYQILKATANARQPPAVAMNHNPAEDIIFDDYDSF